MGAYGKEAGLGETMDEEEERARERGMGSVLTFDGGLLQTAEND